MSEDPAKNKVELLELLAGVEPEAAKLELVAKDMLQHARLARDAAGPLHKLYSQAPVDALEPKQWTAQVQSWHTWYGSSKALQSSVTSASSFVAISEAVTNTAVTGVMSIYGPSFRSAPDRSLPTRPTSPAIEQAGTQLFHVLERFPLLEKTRASIQRLGLNSRAAGLTTSLEHLEHARGSLEMPVVEDGGSVPVLVSLRECIDASITELIRRRPKQEEAKGWKGKVLSLGRQCARSGLSADHFDRLGTDMDTIMNQLSAAKQSEMDRKQLMDHFHRALLSLNSLLESIDEKLLRPN